MSLRDDPFPILWAEDLAAAVNTARPLRYGLAGRTSSLLPPLPDLEPLECEVPLDANTLKRAGKALAVLEELRRREAERDATCGEGHD